MIRLSRNTLDRWLRACRARGLDGLRPEKRADRGVVRRHPELFEEAAALRRDMPARSAAHIADILGTRHGIHVPPRTIREQLAKRDLQQAALATEPVAYGRYEAARPSVPKRAFREPPCGWSRVRESGPYNGREQDVSRIKLGENKAHPLFATFDVSRSV